MPMLLALLLGRPTLPPVQAQGQVPVDCWPGADYLFFVVTNWVDRVDLDGDGQPEFLQWSFETSQYCMQCGEYDCGGHYYADGTEALYPTASVQLYVELLPSRVFVSAVLTNAQPIVPEPQPGGPTDPFWEWNAPEAMAWLEIVGLGDGLRRREVWGGPWPIIEYSNYGYLNRDNTNCLFGFRVSKADGWHLGWLRLVYHYTCREVGHCGWVQLAEYDIHPEPNTEIRAGEYVQPRLQIRLVGEQVIVSWPADYRVCALERTMRLDPPNWQPGPPTTTNSVVFDASDAPWYFRLKR